MPIVPRSRRTSFLAIAVLASLTIAQPSLGALADIEPHSGMLRYPAVSAEHIVFSYANDLWVVPRSGGMALPLVSPPGAEEFPRFSPDGQTIAFMGNYEGGRDLYTINVRGGLAHRVTYHPTVENLCGWTPDGQLLYYARGIEGNPQATQLFTVSPQGGLPQKLPVPYGAQASISPDGTWLAYTPHTRDQRTWKRYRGGMATNIWLFNLRTHESRQVTDWEGTDTLPMWHGSRLYYLSDSGPEHRLNIWSYEPRTGDREQLTHFTDHDLRWPSIGPGSGNGEIVFQAGSALYLLDLGTRVAREVKVTIPGDRPTIRPRTINALGFVHDGSVSSTGQRVVLSARGDIWTAPAEHGVPRNLTRTSDIAERDPAWSPDGRWIAYFSDETDEYELYITQSDGRGETRQLTHDGGPYKFAPTWSPDSKTIAFYDKTGTLYLCSIEDGALTKAFQDPGANRPPISWSHNSKWIAYASSNGVRHQSSIWLYNVDTAENHEVTSRMFSDVNPVFDRKGDYLYFASSRTFSPSYSDIDSTFIYHNSQVLLAVPLRADIDDPFKLKIDEETWKDEAADDDKDDADEPADEPTDAPQQATAPVSPIHGTWTGTLSGLAAAGMPADTIDFTMNVNVAASGEITGSITAMNMTMNFTSASFDASTGVFNATALAEGATVSFSGTVSNNALTGQWEVAEAGVSGAMQATRQPQDPAQSEADGAAADPEKADTSDKPLHIDLDGFEQRAIQLPVQPGRFGRMAVNNRNQLIYSRFAPDSAGIKLFDINEENPSEKTVVAGGGGFDITADGQKIAVFRGSAIAIHNAAPGAAGKAVVTSPMNVQVDPREEWQQIFNDVWRIFRDFFYVDNLHEVDWPAMRRHYAQMLKDCVSRDDLNFVIGEMISELNVGHAYRGGGDTEGQPGRSVGMLGVDWELHDGAYRIRAIHEGAEWDSDARNPLTRPGLNVEVGDYVLAVNGVPIDTSLGPWAAFVDTAGRPTALTIAKAPDMDHESARDIIVRPVGSENQLRYRSWIERNRQYVADKTDGKVGYIYVPNTGVNGQSDLFRQFYGQIDREALIIDERWNGGGQIPTRFIELLNRPRTNYWAVRDGEDWVWPPDSHQGPKCMLINGLAGSGGDMFPWLFRQAGLGKLIGTRTWGGLVGISGNPPLVDNGFIRVPTFGFYEKDGTWGVEGHGTDPDIEVIDDPALMVDGGDPQIDAAIRLMLQEITENPYRAPNRPTPPDRSGMGIPDDDK